MKAFPKPLIIAKKELRKNLLPSDGALSDREIADGLKRKDESILGYLYSKHVRDLFRFGSQISKDKEIVKDCIQDVFTALIRRNIPVEKVKTIKSYLYKSLYRAIIEKARTERKYLTGHPALDHLDGFEIEISGESRMINEETHRLKVIKVNEQLKNLSKKQKQAILLYYYEGFSHEEIAELMHLNHKDLVRKLIRRGLDSIRRKILMFVLSAIYILS
ncbi:MAG: RNA polymerase sigma factor [Cytophagales bacterium]|nr:RNA polymerase sigma factor [Cytophagales bacterium]